jgi:hypothetical protein
MSPTNKPRPQGTPVQPNLSSLLARYLDRQAAAHQDGLAAAEIGEVVPYEVGPVQPIDARPAWEEAVAVAKQYGPVEQRSGAPPQWSVFGRRPRTEIGAAVLRRQFHSSSGTSRFDPGRQAERASESESTCPGADAGRQGGKRTVPACCKRWGALRLAKHFDG